MTSSRITCSGQNLRFSRNNNPLCYIKSSKLGAAQIRWLSELALYDFDIVYRTGKSNLVADALSRRPEVEEEIEREVLPEAMMKSGSRCRTKSRAGGSHQFHGI